MITNINDHRTLLEQGKINPFDNFTYANIASSSINPPHPPIFDFETTFSRSSTNSAIASLNKLDIIDLEEFRKSATTSCFDSSIPLGTKRGSENNNNNVTSSIQSVNNSSSNTNLRNSNASSNTFMTQIPITNSIIPLPLTCNDISDEELLNLDVDGKSNHSFHFQYHPI